MYIWLHHCFKWRNEVYLHFIIYISHSGLVLDYFEIIQCTFSAFSWTFIIFPCVRETLESFTSFSAKSSWSQGKSQRNTKEHTYKMWIWTNSCLKGFCECLNVKLLSQFAFDVQNTEFGPRNRNEVNGVFLWWAVKNDHWILLMTNKESCEAVNQLLYNIYQQ